MSVINKKKYNLNSNKYNVNLTTKYYGLQDITKMKEYIFYIVSPNFKDKNVYNKNIFN